MIRNTAAGLLWLCLSCVTSHTIADDIDWNLPGEPPYLIAHYLPWFEVAPADAPDQLTWRHWRWDGNGQRRDPNVLLPDGRRDLATAYYPLIGPYSSHDREVFRYQLETAKAAGVSALLVLWYGPGSQDADVHLPMMLAEAEAADMRLALCYEEKLNWPPYRHPIDREQILQSYIDDMQYIIDRYGSHPAYLRADGRPFVAQFNYWGEDDLGPRFLTPVEFEQAFARLSEPIYYCRQNLDRPAMHPTIDAAYMWIKPDPVWVRDYAIFAGRAEALYRDNRLDFFMGFVSPGFDDTGVSAWGGGKPRILPRNGLDVLEQTMALATIGDPELIQIVTWNDWQEGTAVEPSREHGFAYLDAIEQWWGRLTGRPVNLDDNREPLRALVERIDGPTHADKMPPQIDALFDRVPKAK
ncbi:MAG: glycoside hydrolase family 99-like domain-containing protein [Planctomycetota bacterium]